MHAASVRSLCVQRAERASEMPRRLVLSARSRRMQIGEHSTRPRPLLDSRSIPASGNRRRTDFSGTSKQKEREREQTSSRLGSAARHNAQTTRAERARSSGRWMDDTEPGPVPSAMQRPRITNPFNKQSSGARAMNALHFPARISFVFTLFERFILFVAFLFVAPCVRNRSSLTYRSEFYLKMPITYCTW